MDWIESLVGREQVGMRLDRWFAANCANTPHSLLQKWLRKGMVRVDGKKAEANLRLQKGQIIRYPLQAKDEAESSAPKKKASTKDIEFLRGITIYDDRDIIVFNKPAGLPSQGGSGVGRNMDALLANVYPDSRPHLVHRLDRDTSGVLVVAKTPSVARKLSDAFSSRETDKIYLALVIGVPRIKQGEINMPLAKGDDEGRGREKMAINSKGKSAITRYRVIDQVAQEMALVELMPLTGRTHQLRVHMAAAGHPILGDGKYGGQQAFSTLVPEAKKLHLHAWRLSLPLKSGKTLEAPLPQHMLHTMEALGISRKLR